MGFLSRLIALAPLLVSMYLYIFIHGYCRSQSVIILRFSSQSQMGPFNRKPCYLGIQHPWKISSFFFQCRSWSHPPMNLKEKPSHCDLFAWGTKKQITFLISSGVPIRKTINTYHVSWVNQLFLWPFSSSQTVSVPEANSKNIFSKSREFSSGKSPRYIKKSSVWH
jgi:hypothetical protein